MKKKALILVFSNLVHDARVKRQVFFLKEKFDVTVVCFEAEKINAVEIIKVKQTELTLVRKLIMGICLISRFYSLAYSLFHGYSTQLKSLTDRSFDLIIANDIDTLPLAFQLRSNAKILFDAHEYAPRHFENNPVWKIFFQPFYVHLCKKFIPRVNSMTTVGKGLASEYENNFKIKPTVVTNAPNYHAISPSPVNPEKIRLVHHGIANPSRRLDLMIEMMSHLDQRFTLDMFLMTSDYASSRTKAYIQNLKESAGKDPRIQILPPVKSHEIVPIINSYDIGVFLIPPINFNYANTLPNKFFEFIQARLGIAIGPTPEMAEIVNQYNLGVVSDDFSPKTLADKLNALTRGRITDFKQHSDYAAKEFCSEKNGKIMDELISKMLI